MSSKAQALVGGFKKKSAVNTARIRDNNLAVTLGKLGEYRMAREALIRAGSEATAANNIGYLYLLDGKNKEAAESFEKAIELNPAFYGIAHENLKRANESLKE